MSLTSLFSTGSVLNEASEGSQPSARTHHHHWLAGVVRQTKAGVTYGYWNKHLQTCTETL